MLHLRTVQKLNLVLPLILLACHKSTEALPSSMVAYQIPGCASGLAGSPARDSCFSYQFDDALLMDFCAVGNCCPDSNRFSIRHSISNDSIVVTIADTAAQLCNCICPYVLHAEFYNLPRNTYWFICQRWDYSSQALLYAVFVHR